MTIPVASFVRDPSVGSIVAIALAVARYETDDGGSRKLTLWPCESAEQGTSLNVKRNNAVFGSQGFTQKEFVMKRFWHTCLAVIASATMTAGVANAQNDWNVPSEIGSYQSILSRAGYGNGMPATAGRAVGGPAVGGSGSANMTGLLDGTMVNGSGSVNGGVVTGEVVNGGSGTVGMPYNGSASSAMGQPMGTVQMGTAQPVYTQPRVAQPVYTQPRMAQPVVTQPRMVSDGAVYDSGVTVGSGYVDNGFGGVVDGGCGGNVYSGVVDSGISYAEPAYSGPVFNGGYTGAQLFSGGGRARSANWVLGIFALSFERDFEDGVLLSQNSAGHPLFTTDADSGNFGGWGISLARRNCNGKGLELRYWALNTSSQFDLGAGPFISGLPTLEFLEHTPSARTVLSIYDTALTQTVTRETDINNFEVNLLNNGGFYKTRRGRSAAFELFGGVRWFQFDEALTYTAFGDVATFPLATESFSYQSQVTNDLVGFQLGARNELCFTNRLRGFFGISTGIFNNHITTQQNFFDANGVGAFLTDGPSTGRDYNYSDTKNDVAFLGEIDAGVTYQLTQSVRARFGYRALGVAGVALAADQIPVDFRRTDRVQNAESNGSLLLHGGYVGLETCF